MIRMVMLGHKRGTALTAKHYLKGWGTSTPWGRSRSAGPGAECDRSKQKGGRADERSPSGPNPQSAVGSLAGGQVTGKSPLPQQEGRGAPKRRQQRTGQKCRRENFLL